jgi:hypothetical protein
MKIDRVIDIVRQYKLDEMMTAGAGGFTSAGDQTRAGYDPVMGPPVTGEKAKKYLSLGKGSRKRWMKKKEDVQSS